MNYWESTREKIEAQSEAWLSERARGIGGSEIGIIMGVSPYRTQYSLWLEKTGRRRPENISALPHVQRGIQGEKSARMLLERKMLASFIPKSWQLGDVCRCNDDGYSLDRNMILEIKCMGKVAHEEARGGKIPESYRLQCQWNMMVSGADRCLFVAYRPEDEDLIEIEVLPDIEEHKKLKVTAERWWEVHVKRDMAPPLSSKDFIDCDLETFKDVAIRYKYLKEEHSKMTLEIEKLHASLCEFVTPDIPAVRGFGVKVARSTRKGAIDYKKIDGLTGVDLEQYRKPSTVVTTITFEGDDTSETT